MNKNMKKIELQPTFSNLLETFKEDSIGRNKDVCYFISLLDSLEEGNSIAINSSWGSGKTFFVKHIKMVLEANNEFCNNIEKKDKETINSHYNYFCNISKINMSNKLYLPIYYDAWKYDNDDDPVMSIVYEIISTLNNKYDFEGVNINYKKLLNGIFDALKLSGLPNFIDAINKDENLSNIIKSRDLKTKIDEFLNILPEERADNVVIFIDELDRCKPTYAVKLLERIKHYFNNDIITFVFSTNLEELQSSVKCVYGSDFNAYRYLDRFFDLKLPLPEIDIDNYYNYIDCDGNANNYFDKMCSLCATEYNFSMRDIAKYHRYLKMTTWNLGHSGRSFNFSEEFGYLCCICYFAPIIIGLFIHDINTYNDFIKGKNSSPFIKLLGVHEGNLFLNNKLFGKNHNELTLTEKEEKLTELYDAVFNTTYDGGFYHKLVGEIEINRDTQKYLINIISVLSNEGEKNRKMH